MLGALGAFSVVRYVVIVGTAHRGSWTLIVRVVVILGRSRGAARCLGCDVGCSIRSIRFRSLAVPGDLGRARGRGDRRELVMTKKGAGRKRQSATREGGATRTTF